MAERMERLGELAEALGGSLQGDPGARVGSVIIDSRLAGPGDLFVALPGSRTDGHLFVEDALLRGAFALVRRNGWQGAGIITVPDPLEALWKAARAVRARVNGRVIGVTGSNGKTTTRELIHAGLERSFRVERSASNLNNHIGLPLTMLNLDPGADFLVLEMGMNHAGELAFLGEIARPDMTLVTNIARCHMEFFESHDDVARAKAELIQATNPQGACVIPVGEPVLRAAARERGLTTVCVGEGGDRWLRDDSGDAADGDGTIAMPWEIPLHLSLPGRHNLRNAICALAVCELCGADPSIAADGMRTYRGMRGRGRVSSVSGVTILDESYNANPDSVLACLDQMSGFPRPWVLVLGEMRELGPGSVEMHIEVLEAAIGVRPRLMILVGDDYARALGAIADRNDGAGEPVIHLCADAAEASRLAVEMVRPGDSVLVKGSHSVGLERAVSELEEGA